MGTVPLLQRTITATTDTLPLLPQPHMHMYGIFGLTMLKAFGWPPPLLSFSLPLLLLPILSA